MTYWSKNNSIFLNNFKKNEIKYSNPNKYIEKPMFEFNII